METQVGKLIRQMESERGMHELRVGAAGYIAAVEASGELRRRLIELGFFPGEAVEKVLKSPLGDPSAYLVRGAVTAIRDKDAAAILVSPIYGGSKPEEFGRNSGINNEK